jgi:hypothetical protein
MIRYRERFDLVRIWQRLQEVLSSSEKAPGIRELARQLGCKHHFLEDNLPDLCKQIGLQRRTERRKQREERVARTCTEICQAVMLFHQQGVYPGYGRVTEQLNKPHILRTKEGHEAWRVALEELGYSTNHLKKYA